VAVTVRDERDWRNLVTLLPTLPDINDAPLTTNEERGRYADLIR